MPPQQKYVIIFLEIMELRYKLTIIILIVSFNLFCSCSDDSNEICLESTISIVNDCDGLISVSYFDYEEVLDLMDEILQIDRCNVTERKAQIEPSEEVNIEVYLGRCSLDDEYDFDNCQQYISDESITIQFGDQKMGYNINKIERLVITNSSFD